MGKSMNLNNLSEEEAQQILQVIQKDFELRQKERERLSKIEEVINEEENKTELLTKQRNFNENCCIRCCQTFGFIFNRKQTCRTCKLYVCKSCSIYDDNIKGYNCKACLKEIEWKHKSLDWFYDNVSKKYKRFGSAKVVRTLYKSSDKPRGNKYHSDNESDSGYDPSLYSSFGQSGSARVKTRPSLTSIFPEILGNDKTGQELDNSLFPPPPTMGPLVPLSSNGDAYNTSPDSSLEHIQMSSRSTPTPTPRTSVTTPTQTMDDLDNKEQGKRDIYKEYFDTTKRTEEAKFRVRFDNLVTEMQQSFENVSPRDGALSTGYGSNSYGDLMTNYKSRVKDLLVSLSQRLELAVESFDETCAHSPGLTSLKVRQIISKLIEDRLGESLDLTSDEAVSDLSSLSDDSGEQKSYEDQIAQAVIARVLELHRNMSGVHLSLDEPMDHRISDSSSSEEKTAVKSRNSSLSEEKVVVVRTRNSSVSDEQNVIDLDQKEKVTTRNNNNDIASDKNANLNKSVDSDNDVDATDGENQNFIHIESEDGVPLASPKLSDKMRLDSKPDQEKIDESKILQEEFEKLRTFARETVPRPLYEEVRFEEEVEPEPIEESMDYVTVDHDESQQEFSSRFFTFDKVHDSDNRGLPDFSDLDYEYHDFGVNEVDPDLLSMNLAPIEEETEEELEEDKGDMTEYEQDWRGNWMFKGAGGIDSFNNIAKNKVAGEFGNMYMMIPQPNGEFMPQIGNQVVDDVSSDLSNSEDDRDSLDGFSDEENSFYAKTSAEIARITRKSSSSSTPALVNSSNQTEGESDAESIISRPYSSSFSDSGIRSNRMDQNSFDSSKMSEKSAVKLSEELVPSEAGDPKFEIPPDSVTIPEGEPAKLTCRVAGTQPLDVFWYRVKEEVEELENSANYEIVKDGCRQYLTMYNMTKEDAGQYMCMAVNENGRCCQYFILSVKKNTQEMKAPEFLKGVSDVEVTEGQSVKFRCKVKGYPQPRIVWYKDGQILMNKTNYRLERFGNRDYLLVIDSASMDEDAEYSVLAKNIAGEVRSSAQLIVEPQYQPESASITAKKEDKKEKRSETEKTERSASPEFPSLSYLPLRRSRPSSTDKTSVSSSTSDRKTDHNLSNLSKKVSMTKDSVTEVAEDMLSSSKELTEINKSIAAMDKILEDLESNICPVDDIDRHGNNGLITSLGDVTGFEALDNYLVMQGAAENVRKVTTSALDYLNSTDSVFTQEKQMGAIATSTPRSSESERVFNIDEDMSSSRIALATQDDSVETHDTSNDSHKSEMSFSLNPMTTSTNASRDKTLKSDHQKVSQSKSHPKHVSKESNQLKLVSHTEGPIKSSDTSQIYDSADYSNSLEMVDSTHNSSGSDPLRVNLGPKRENKERYERDFYIVNTPQVARRTPPTSPRDPVSPKQPISPREEKKTAHTEEKIYLTASNVYNLENKVQTLQDKMRAVNALQEQDKMNKLEDQVARTVAQVATSEKQVRDVEKSVTKLNEPRLVKLNESQKNSKKSRQAPSAPQQRPVTPPREKPEPTFLKGVTSEEDLPESRTEYNEDYGAIELPSVNRLKAMFGNNDTVNKDGSVKRIHSITARSVPKEQLEKLRKASEDHPQSRVAMKASSEPVNPGRATALKTGQQIKAVPNKPKPVYQSTHYKSEESLSSLKVTQLPQQSIQISSNVKRSDSQKEATSHQQKSAQKTMKITLATGVTNRPISPVQSEPTMQAPKPMKSHVTGKTQAPKPPSQSNTSTQNVKTGNVIDTPEERKSPKIKSGAISAMSKFWEKKMTDGPNEESAPEILEYD